MGVKSFRTGTGQKRNATEKGIIGGRAEYFHSTRRTGLSPKGEISLLYDIKFRFHSYGATMGTLFIYWSDADSPATWSQVLFDYQINSTQPLLTGQSFIAGQKHTSGSAEWGYVSFTSPSLDGRPYFVFRIGSSFTSDFAVDNFTIHLQDQGSTQVGSIPTTTSDWQTTSSLGTSLPSSPPTTWFIPNSTTNGQWVVDSSGTPSSGTGPLTGPSGSASELYLYVESSANYNQYTVLRPFADISTYIT